MKYKQLFSKIAAVIILVSATQLLPDLVTIKNQTGNTITINYMHAKEVGDFFASKSRYGSIIPQPVQISTINPGKQHIFGAPASIASVIVVKVNNKEVAKWVNFEDSPDGTAPSTMRVYMVETQYKIGP